MKRRNAIILAAILIFLLAPGALAEDEILFLTNPPMSLRISDSYIVFREDMEEDDPNLALLGIDAATAREALEASDAHLMALHPDGHEFAIMETDPGLFNFGDLRYLDDNEILEMTEKAIRDEGLADSGIEMSDPYIYENSQAKYVAMKLKAPGIQAMQYITMVNGQMICMMMRVSGGEVDKALEEELRTIVDSASYLASNYSPTSAPQISSSVPTLSSSVRTTRNSGSRIFAGMILAAVAALIGAVRKKVHANRPSPDEGDYDFCSYPNTTVGITRYRPEKHQAVITVPRRFGGHFVTSICENAFANCDWISAITIENNEQDLYIGASAFSGCTSLTRIEIPDNVKYIDASAFTNCNPGLTIISPKHCCAAEYAAQNGILWRRS